MAQDINTDASPDLTPGGNGLVSPAPPTGVTPPELAQQPVVVIPSPPAPDPAPNPISAPVPSQPTPIVTAQDVPTQPPPPQAVTSAVTPTKQNIFKKIFGNKKTIVIIGLVLLFGSALTGAYLFGKSHERVVVQAPPILPINLPPQAVLVNNCIEGRGKQYILPKDIPLGPVYDVVNDKVIAVEYNFKASDLFVSADRLSDTLIPFFKGNYQAQYFNITPGTIKPGQNQADTPINVAIFVVAKDEANKVACEKAAS